MRRRHRNPNFKPGGANLIGAGVGAVLGYVGHGMIPTPGASAGVAYPHPDPVPGAIMGAIAGYLGGSLIKK